MRQESEFCRFCFNKCCVRLQTFVFFFKLNTFQDFKQIVTHIFIVGIKLCQYFLRLTNSVEQNVVMKLICLISQEVTLTL